MEPGPALSRPRPTVSIFTPVYNDEQWLPGLIECVLGQSFSDWELVIGDNASEADIATIVARYADPRVWYHRFERHVAIDEHFNRTMLRTTGAWVQLLCVDDRIQPTCVEHLVDAMQREPDEPRLAMILTACRRVYPDGSSAERIWYGSKPKIDIAPGRYDSRAWFEILLRDGHPPFNLGSVAVSRSVLDESGGFFRPEVGLSCDVELSLRASAYGDIVYLDEQLLDFMVRPDADSSIRLWQNRTGGVSVTPLAAALSAALRVHEHRRRVTRKERAAVAAAIARSYLQRAAQQRVLADGRGRSAALSDVLRAIRHSPWTVLAPYHLAYGLAAILAPRGVLAAVQTRLSARHT